MSRPAQFWQEPQRYDDRSEAEWKVALTLPPAVVTVRPRPVSLIRVNITITGAHDDRRSKSQTIQDPV